MSITGAKMDNKSRIKFDFTCFNIHPRFYIFDVRQGDFKRSDYYEYNFET